MTTGSGVWKPAALLLSVVLMAPFYFAGFVAGSVSSGLILGFRTVWERWQKVSR